MIETTTILPLVSAICIIASIVFSIKWKQAKVLLKEIAEFAIVLSNTLDDDKITDKEFRDLVKEMTDVIDAVKSLKK